MIPNNAFIDPPLPAPFNSPYNLPPSQLSRACRGGIALNNASRGRDFQNWYVWWEEGVAYFGPEATPLVAAGSLPIPGVTQISMAFDNNMNPILAWMDATGAHIRYFSAATTSYVIIDITGATSCLVVVDDPRNFYNANSDAVFAYTLSTGLWYRYQRENYSVARQVDNRPNRLMRMGMGTQNRFQFERMPN